MADAGILGSMRNAADALKDLNKQANVDDIADLKEELDDMMAENEEKQNYFARMANENKDELLAELDELEADALAGELEALEPVPVQKIKQSAKRIVEE